MLLINSNAKWLNAAGAVPIGQSGFKMWLARKQPALAPELTIRTVPQPAHWYRVVVYRICAVNSYPLLF